MLQTINMEPSYPRVTKILDLAKELLLAEFPLATRFRHVANVIPAEKPGKQTVLEFNPMIPTTEWKAKNEVIYIFTVNDRIVKIGGSRNGLAERCSSYLCGHHIPERGKSGKCSVTNAYIYNTFAHYLQTGHTIRMYAFAIPPVMVTVSVWGDEKQVAAQVFHVFESQALDLYAKQCGHNPCLSDNSDPSFRS